MKSNRTPASGIRLAFTLCLSACLALVLPATGQTDSKSWSEDPRVESRTYVFTPTGETLPYAVFVPSKVSKQKKAPLIIALRGYGGNPGVFMQDPAFKLAEKGGYIIAAPMGYTSGANFGNPGSGDAKASEYSERDVMNVLAIVRKEFNIDDRRIYLVGHSQGGAGALHIADKYSSIWAGVAGLSAGAPGYQLDANAKFKDVAVLILVGDKDGFIGSVRSMDERMKSLNIPHDYKELPGLDHGSIIMGGLPDVFAFFQRHPKTASHQSTQTKTNP